MSIHLLPVFRTNAELDVRAIRLLLYLLLHDGKTGMRKTESTDMSVSRQGKHTADQEVTPWCEYFRCTIKHDRHRNVPKSIYFFPFKLDIQQN